MFGYLSYNTYQLKVDSRVSGKVTVSLSMINEVGRTLRNKPEILTSEKTKRRWNNRKRRPRKSGRVGDL